MASTSIVPDSSISTRLPVSITRVTTKANDARSKLLAVVDERHTDEAAPLLVRWVANEFKRFNATIDFCCCQDDNSHNVHTHDWTDLLQLNEDRKGVNNAVLMAVKAAGNRMQDELAEEREARRELQRYALIQEEAIREFGEQLREQTRRTAVLQDEVYGEREKVRVAEERTLEADGRACELEGELEVVGVELRESLDETCGLRDTCRLLREQVKDANESCEVSRSLADTAMKKVEEAETRAHKAEVQASEAEAKAREAEARAREAEAEKVGLDCELEQSRRKSDGLDRICKKLSKDVSDAKKETSRARACIAETVAEKDRMTAGVEETRVKLLSAETSSQMLEGDVAGAREEIARLIRQAEEAEAARVDLEDDLEQSRLQTRTLETASREEATGMNETIQTLRKRTADFEVALTLCQEQAASLQRVLTSSETRCRVLDGTHDQAVCGLQELLDTACRAGDGLRGEIRAVECARDKLGAELEESRRGTRTVGCAMDKLTTELEESRREVRTVGCAMDKLSTELEESRRKMHIAECARDTLSIELEESRRETWTVGCAREMLSTDLDRANHTNTALDVKVKFLTAENTELHDACLTQAAQFIDTREKLAATERQCEAAEARVVALELAWRALDNELVNAHEDHGKIRKELEQASKSLTESWIDYAVLLGQKADTVNELKQLRLHYDFVEKEAEKVAGLEAEVDQQKDCVQTELYKVQNIEKELAGRDKWVAKLQEVNRKLRQDKDDAKGLVETYKKAACAAWIEFDRASEELGGMQRERDWYKEDARHWKGKVESCGPDTERFRADIRDLQAELKDMSSAWSELKEVHRRLQMQFEEAKQAADGVEAGLEAEKASLISNLEVATQGRAKAEEECETLKQSKFAMSDNHTKLQATAFATHSRVVSTLKEKVEKAQKDLEVAEKKTQDALLEQSARLEGALSLQLIEPQVQIADLRKEAVKLREEKVTAESKALQLEADVSAAKETLREQEVTITQYLMDIKTAGEKIAALKQQHGQDLRISKTEAEDQIAKLKEQHKEKLDHLMCASADQLEDLTECENKLTECEKKLAGREKLRAEAVEEVGELKKESDVLNADNAELRKRWDESREAGSELKTKVEQLEAQCDEAVDNVRKEVQCKLDEYEVKFRRLECCAMQLQAERITQLASRGANCEPTPSRESSAAVDEVKAEENEVKPEGMDVQLQETDIGEGNGPPTPAHTLSPGPESPASDISSADGEQKDDEEEPPTPATTWSSDMSSANGDHEDDQPESPTPGQTLTTPLESPESAGSKVKEEYHEDEDIGENINVVQRGVRVLTAVHAQIHGEVSAQVHGELHAQLNAESRKRKRFQLCRTSQPKCNGTFDHMCDTCRGSKRARLPQGIQPDDAIMDGDFATLGSSPCPIIAGSAELINNAVDLAVAPFPSDEEATQSSAPVEKRLQDGLHTTVTDSPSSPGLVDGSKPPAPTLMTRVLQKVSHSSKGMARRTPNDRVSRTKTRVTKTSERMFVTP
ncbi:hypothetical protein LTR97_003735 [Elasticomyces elasticus]|uniref:Uncharacterized protein n=1 Tax=Elasticomyces elasticus TaxID=574655 RepID=A0AAN7VUH3_9PEZI|nr:hypothetical protein LTR97_003735 [Elasticomyces elasticus]